MCTGKHIRKIVFNLIHSPIGVLNFMFPACRLNTAEVAGITHTQFSTGL